MQIHILLSPATYKHGLPNFPCLRNAAVRGQVHHLHTPRVLGHAHRPAAELAPTFQKQQAWDIPCSMARPPRLRRDYSLNGSPRSICPICCMELAAARQAETRDTASSMPETDNLGLQARLPPCALGGGDEHVIFQPHVSSSRLQQSEGRFGHTHTDTKYLESFRSFKSHALICFQEKT